MTARLVTVEQSKSNDNIAVVKVVEVEVGVGLNWKVIVKNTV